MQPARVSRATVLGGGAFGTALSFALARKGADVRIWLLSKNESERCNASGENVVYMPGPKLLPNMLFTSDVDAALVEHRPELIILAIPTQFVHSFLVKHRRCFPQGVPIVIACKGIEIATLRTPFDLVVSALPKVHHQCICVLSGPSFAREIADGLFTSVVIAATDIELAHQVQRQISTPDGSFRAYATTDIVGCEIASAVKNVLALASGMADGLGQGVNARAALICRGLQELSTLARALGSDGRCLPGLGGVGDLLLTCSSPLSRNFTVGQRLAKGESLEHIMATTKAVAEGVPTAKALHALSAKVGVYMPLCEQVYKILYEGRKVEVSFKKLLKLPLLDEDALLPVKLLSKL